jgi:hypothetical protein
MGFPTRISRNSLGPKLVDATGPTNSEKKLDAARINLLMWQAVGAQMVVPRLVIHADVVGTVVTTAQQLCAWDVNGEMPTIEWTRTGTGVYTAALDEISYPDDHENDVAIILRAGQAWTLDFDDTRAKVQMTSDTAWTVKVWGPAISTAVDRSFAVALF